MPTRTPLCIFFPVSCTLIALLVAWKSTLQLAMMMAEFGDDDDDDDEDGDAPWSPDTPSPLDRYPSGAPIFDFAEEVETRTMRGPRANRPRRGQGDRAGIARADIPRTSKNSRSGGRVRYLPLSSSTWPYYNLYPPLEQEQSQWGMRAWTFRRIFHSVVHIVVVYIVTGSESRHHKYQK